MFRRKQGQDEQAAAPATEQQSAVSDESSAALAAGSDERRAAGPFDIDEVGDDGVQRVDLGSLLVPPIEGRELRMQVDESSGAVQAVMLAGSDGALEFQAFAAPRGGDLWADVRPQIAADITRRGGQVTEREGRFGTELICQMPVERPDGTSATQPSRIIGVNGPRWMLRASLLGRPALEPESSSAWEDALARVVVRRGTEAKPVGEPLDVVLPDQARRVG